MSAFKSIISHVSIAAASLLVIFGLGQFLVLPGLRALTLGGLYIGTLLLAALLGWAFSRGTLQRLDRAARIAQAWLRGDLAPSIADPSSDQFGRLTRQLDQIVHQYAQDKQDLTELRARESRLSDQVRALSVVEERNRLARDLHDGVKQHLFSLSMTASAIQARIKTDPHSMTSDLAEMVGQMEQTTQTVQHEMAQLIDDLRPASLQERGLELALNDYCLLFGAREHLLIYLAVQGDTTLLPPALAETLYVVAQEALNNIACHARATRVDVELNTIPEQTTLTIRDNGAGFDQSRPYQGMGLSNMRERLLALGGRLTIESQIGLGTLVTAEVGLARPLPISRSITRLDENRPLPEIANWAWLGQKLTIPVGEVWPWSSNDEVHLFQPVVESSCSPLSIQPISGFLGLDKGFRVISKPTATVLTRLQQTLGGAEWSTHGVHWSFRKMSGTGGQQVLYRNGQPLAAVQYQGRQMAIWSEFIYAGHGYRLSQSRGTEGGFILADELGQELLHVSASRTPEIHLLRPVPLPLLNMTILRLLEERENMKTLWVDPEMPS